MKKYIVFTSNAKGGVAQFALLLAESLLAYSENTEVVLMVPELSAYKNSRKVRTLEYKKIVDTFATEKKFQEIIRTIHEEAPTHIIFAESCIPNHQLSKYLRSYYRLSIVVHDAVPHPSGFTLRGRMRDFYSAATLRSAVDYFQNVIVLSEAVKRIFMNKHQQYKGEIIQIRLCSHLVAEDIDLKERTIEEEYYLFFGRIEKYKGIEYLLKAYRLDTENELPLLVLAGSGELSNEEELLYKELQDRVKFMNYYIADEELTGLIGNAKAVVLPYIEASQSGVIPMAYQQGKPVVVSNLEGLTENVLEMKTGFVFGSKDHVQLYEILKDIAQNKYDLESIEKQIADYYAKEFDWEKNVKRILDAN